MTPLSNKDAEVAVLGAMIQDPMCLPIALAKLFRDCFYDLNHQLIYDAIVRLYDKNTGIDLTTVVEELNRSGNLAKVGGAYEVMKLTNSVVFSTNIEAHCMILMELYLKRQTSAIGRTLQQNGYDPSKDAFDGLNEAASLITEASETVLKGSQKTMDYYVTKVIEQRDRVLSTGQIGLDTGFRSLNELISGWVNPDLVIVAARPGMGKTAMIISSIHHLSVVNQIPVAVFSLEMSGEQLTQRLESIDSGISHSVLRNNKLSEAEREQIPYTHDRLIQAPIFIEDKPGINIRELRTKANLLKRRNNIKAVFVDYLQLMSGVDEKGKSRENIISEISRGCKLIAKELDIPVIALSQLSRAVESRPDRMPQLSDLRESGSIEQDADEVIFLMRPEYYDMQMDIVIDGQQYEKQGLVLCKIDKNRHGSTKIVPLRFQADLMKYSDYNTFRRLEENPF
jgi:replicative DNA helicase